MASNKRKRESEEPSSENGENGDSDATAHAAPTTEIVDSGFAVMTVRTDKWAHRLSKAQVAAGWGELIATDKTKEIAPSIPPFGFRIRPGVVWEEMKKFNKFVVNGTQFSVGDHIYINNSMWESAENRSDDKQLWVARVMEVRARDGTFVRLRVMYLYWPDELPGGRMPYHGQREMIQSNHMDVLDAQCVLDRAEVYHLSEEEPGMAGNEGDGIYWRQTFDVTDGKISMEEMRRDCICNEPHNPEKLLIECKNKECGLWNHERCLEDAAMRQQWHKTLNGSVKEEQEEGDSISVVNVSRDSPASTKGAGRRRSKKSPKKSRKSNAEPAAAPWKDHLEATVERNSDDPNEVAGIIRVTEIQTGRELSVEDLVCLKCHSAFV